MAFSHSFVVPSYNHAQYIGETIESLLAQELQGSEIVICDDHSSDNSREIIERYRHHERVRIVHPPHRLGMMRNYNFCTEQATGEWVSLLGSDDRAQPCFARLIRDGVARTPDTVVVTGDYDHIDGDGRKIKSEKVLSVRPVTHPPQTFYTQLAAPKVPPVANAFHRPSWEKVGGFPERATLIGDWGLWLRLAPLGSFVHVSEPLAEYRISYRPNIAFERRAEALRDDVYIVLTLIPEIAQQIPNVEMGRVEMARRTRLRSLLAEYSRMLKPEERAFAVELLREWAAKTELSGMLQRFAQGEAISAGWRDSTLRRVLRDIYKALRR
jgi:glycosyltransferase involved in cell wall biosynthesis